LSFTTKKEEKIYTEAFVKQEVRVSISIQKREEVT
jgi:hypothetical protein